MRKTRLLGIAGACALALAAVADAQAACPDEATVARLAADMLTRTPSTAPDVETMDDALCAQDELVKALAAEWGEPVGYKAGLTSEPAQKAFGVTQPVRGRLFGGTMLEDGARVSAAYGAVPRYEADMIAVVADDGVNEAQTPLDVLSHLTSVRPFIELPDLVVADPRGLSGPKLTAINVGARMGVLGAPVPVEPTREFLDALATMTVTVTDAAGATLAKAPGAAILGQPMKAVLWLRDNGVTFREGDLVSLGSFGPLLKPEAGLTATVTYRGLPGDPSVSVTFE